MSNNTFKKTSIKAPEFVKDLKLIPLRKDEKLPRVKWGVNDELKFNGTETGYGIDTGRSNLVVIDCDTKGAENGINNFYAQCTQNGYEPDTFTVDTPNEGLHFYYITKNTNLKTSAGTVFGPAIDVRAWGGYVVGPGSTIKNDNGDYIEYKAFDDNKMIAELPEWMETKILETSKKEANSKKPLTNKKTTDSNVSNTKHNRDSSKEEEERNNALVWAIDKMKAAPNGQRNQILNSTSYFMGCKRVDKIQAEKLIEIAIEIGLDEKEAQSTFNSGYEDGLKEELITYSVMVKEYNTKNGITFKEDPKDSEFYSHMSLSYNFWKKYRDDLIYFDPHSSWYAYNNQKGCWEVATKKSVTNMIKEYCEELILQIRLDNPRLPMTVYKAQERVWLKNTIESIEGMAELDFLVKDENKFDSNPYLINCKNGVFNLETQKIEPHSREYFITKNIPVTYIKGARDKYCDMIIEGIAEEERDYLQLIVGEALIGRQPQVQSVFFFHGWGSNGKSTFIDLLSKTNGTYGRFQSPSVLLPDNGRDNYALADFEGIRVAIIEELPDIKQLNSGALKHLVGTDKINARPIYGKNREFVNQSTIFITCNRLPVITETDHGTWRRVLVFNFPYSYKRFKSEIKNSNDKLGDPRVLMAAKHNTSTAEAFLAWRIEGAIKSLEVESTGDVIPQSIIDTVTEWNERNDIMLGWIKESIKFKQDSIALISELFNSYNKYLETRGHSKVSLRFFVEQFTNHTFFQNNNLTYKKGARILKDYEVSSIEGKTKENLPERNNYITNIEFI